MIDIGMYAALGFLVASLLALLLAPALWNRAVRLTTRRLEATMPMSVSDIQADKDQLRAEFAIELRRVEVALEKAKDKATRELVEANKRRVRISELNAELDAAKATLAENENANRVMEQTIRRRLPELENRSKAAKDVIAELEQANAELRQTLSTQSEALKTARIAVQNQRGDIEQMRGVLEGDGGMLGRLSKSAAPKETQRLAAELSRVKEELERNRVAREENEHLRQEINKLASNILAAARAQQQAPAPQREVRDIAETVATYARKPEARPVAAGGNGTHAHAEEFDDATRSPLTARIEESLVVAAAAPPPGFALNEAASLEAAHAATQDATEDEEETAPAKGPLARRLAARRAKRQARKTGGQSLTERLKGVPAEGPET